MSFNTEVVKPGRGRTILIDVSTDGFSSVPYRWGDKSGAYDGASAARQNRLISMSPIKRAFGRNRIAASSTCTIEIDNADGGIDALCGRANFNTQALARFRIYVVIWDLAAGYSDATSEFKQLGEFVLSSWPKQDNTTVTFELADDFMGKLGSGLLLPTFEDWQAVGNTSNNPFAQGIALPQVIDETTPIQLAFGEDMILALPHVIPQGNNNTGDTYEEKIIVPLYCTTDSTAVDQQLVRQVTVEMYPIPLTLETVQDPNTYFTSLPQAVTITGAGTYAENTVWEVQKSPAISKGGLSFYIVYLVVRTDLGQPEIRYALQDPANPSGLQQRIDQLSALAYSGGYDPAAVDEAGTQYKCFASRVVNWYVRCVPGSQITNASSIVGFGISHPIDAITDLVSEYSNGTVDSTSAARVKSATPFAACAGVVQPWTERANDERNPSPPMSLRQVLTELAQSSDLDIFVNWSGTIAFSSDVRDFTTATQTSTLLEIQETELMAGIARWVPGNGERGQAFNRVFLTGGKPSPTTYEDVPFQGPFDIDSGDVDPADRSLELELRQGWRPFRQQSYNPMQWRGIDIVTRERVKFRTHIGGLRLELGDYFKLNWTRGTTLGGPYASTIFQCESITYAPGDDTVEIEAIWRDDTQTERQYLLDDETLLVRSKGALTGSMTEDANPETFTFGGTINLSTMGVAVGDILIVREASEAADSFLYNKAYRIVAINSTTSLDVSAAHTETGHVTVNADWSIVRGATTYPTSVSDPSNYPLGGDMYGKVTATNGTYSDATTGNRLISG